MYMKRKKVPLICHKAYFVAGSNTNKTDLSITTEYTHNSESLQKLIATELKNLVFGQPHCPIKGG